MFKNSLVSIVVIVITIHLATLFLLLAPSPPLQVDKKQNLTVRTLEIPASINKPVIPKRVEKASPQKKTPPKPPPPLKKKKKPSQKKTSPSKKPSSKIAINPELLETLEKKVLAISDPQGKKDPFLYQQTLIGFLQENLHLPDYGEVELELHLSSSGKMVKVVFRKAESIRNQEYLEKALPHLLFPRQPGQKDVQPFIITFCNKV